MKIDINTLNYFYSCSCCCSYWLLRICCQQARGIAFPIQIIKWHPSSLNEEPQTTHGKRENTTISLFIRLIDYRQASPYHLGYLLILAAVSSHSFFINHIVCFCLDKRQMERIEWIEGIVRLRSRLL